MKWSVHVDFAQCRKPAAHFNYHLYVIDSLRAQGLQISFGGTADAALAHLASLRVPGAQAVWGKLTGGRAGRSRDESLVIYRFDARGCTPIDVIFDTGDHRHVLFPAALDRVDLYFKMNRWPSLEYPAKVLPLMNGNGLLSPALIERLKGLRHAPRSRDLVYWTRIWEPAVGGAYTAMDRHNIVEHQVRLFETLAMLEADTDLLAIVPGQLHSMSREECVSRLEARGVKCQVGWGAIDSEALRTALASARVVFLRPGNHSCISWRLTDLLAMGACVVYDGAPHPNWQVPLRPDIHYVDGGCAAGVDYALPATSRYAELIRTIEGVLRDEPRLVRARRSASEYFDHFCTHEQVGAYIVDAVANCERTPRSASRVRDVVRV